MIHDDVSPLRICRLARGWSQVELAAAADVGLTTIRKVEAGGPLAKDIAAKLARALDATANERLAWLEFAVAHREARVAEQIAAEPGLAELLREFRRARETAEPEPAQAEATIAAPPEPAPAEPTGAEAADAIDAHPASPPRQEPATEASDSNGAPATVESRS